MPRTTWPARCARPGNAIRTSKSIWDERSTLMPGSCSYAGCAIGKLWRTGLLDPADTLLLLVGRGSSDPDANANIAKVAHFLKEGYPTAWAAHAYSGVARP